MPTYVDHGAMVDLLRCEFSAVADLASGLTERQWDEPSCLPGWTVHDVLGHMIGTESMLAGEPPPTADTSHLTHMVNPIAEANEVWVESMRPLSGHQMADRWDAVTSRRLATLEAMTQAEFDAPSWTPAGNDETYGRFMRIRHFDCFMHEHDIRFGLGLPARNDPADLGSCLEEVATGLGYIVGRKAGMPEGSRVRIDLTGPLTRTFLIEVEGRARVVDSFDQPPTVGLEMPVALFLRLTGGRDDRRSDAEDQVFCSGDGELARHLARHLAFTI